MLAFLQAFDVVVVKCPRAAAPPLLDAGFGIFA